MDNTFRIEVIGMIGLPDFNVTVFIPGSAPMRMLLPFPAMLRMVALAEGIPVANAPIPEAALDVSVPEVGDTCSICLEDVTAVGTSPGQWIALRRCRHRFHAHCIRQWQRGTCPVCREDYLVGSDR